MILADPAPTRWRPSMPAATERADFRQPTTNHEGENDDQIFQGSKDPVATK